MNRIEMRESVPALSQPTLRAGRLEKTGMLHSPPKMSPRQLRIHQCLGVLLACLIFEGLARKLAPGFLGVFIFFFKDCLTAILLLLCLKGHRNPEATRWLNIMGILLWVLSPCIVVTAVNDPLLAVFGIKQYVLFSTVVVAMSTAYLPNHQKPFFALFRLIALSVFITTLVAVAQNQLPASNWLNLSVAGEDLSAFSAGGYLRVSSTFAFVGQYCYYLNALCYCLPVFFFSHSVRGRTPKIMTLVLVGLFIIGTFVTGSRLSVVGNAGILCVGGILVVVCGGPKALTKIFIPVAIGIALLGMLQSRYPQFFAAYHTRTGYPAHNAELGERIENGLLNWAGGYEQAPPSLLGYGLGVMSNGSDKLSSYADRWRHSGFWTETDQSTTLFEGGWFLMLIWYGFRCWIIIRSLILIFRLRRMEFRIMACFAWGFIAIIGVTGTLSIQPPLTIWWWLAVGLITCLGHFDRQPREKHQNPVVNLWKN